MFNEDFYPTPPEVIERMLNGYDVAGKTILEPSAGKGNIVDYCLSAGAAKVIACEKEPDLRKILNTKCNVIADDFLTVKSEHVSHIDMIVMNPPFSRDEKHILHAWSIAPPGCTIISLCNDNIINSRTFRINRELRELITMYGNSETLGECFSTAERRTDVKVGLVILSKPGEASTSEFEGFFLEDNPTEEQFNGLMPYNFVRDLVNRYIAAVRIYDEQLDAAVRMNALTSQFYSSSMAMSITEGEKPKTRNEFKKDLQKSAWNYIFKKMNMDKYATKGLRQDINKFVEQQTQVPFTMRNIYRMLDIVIGTHEQRMDKALVEVFDRLTMHYDENRYNVEGWKTNSHYLINRKFICPNVVNYDYGRLRTNYFGNWTEIVEDMHKALCYMTGTPYGNTFYNFLHNSNCQPNEWHEWGFFKFKGFKKGTGHFMFKDEDVWARFNQRIAKIKGYPLFEAKRSSR